MDTAATLQLAHVTLPGASTPRTFTNIPGLTSTGMAWSTEGSVSVEMEAIEIPNRGFIERYLDLHGMGQMIKWRFTNRGGTIDLQKASVAFASDQYATLFARMISAEDATKIVNTCGLSGVQQAVLFADRASSRMGNHLAALVLIEGMMAPGVSIRQIDETCRQLDIPTFSSGQDKVKREILPAAKLYLQAA